MSTVYKAYKYRIYPTEIQKELLAKHFGAVRFVYNLALETKIEAYRKGVNYSAYDLIGQLTQLKKDLDWLSEVSIGSLQQSIFDLDNAFRNFYSKSTTFPVFKKKSNGASFRFTEKIYLRNGILFVPKFREGIKIVEHRKLEGDIKFATVSITPTGKYYISIMVKTNLNVLPQSNNIVGIDLGLKSFAVLSDDTEIEAPKFLRKSIERIKILKRRASKKKKGSQNRLKANLRVAILHERVANRRKDFLHKISNQITNDYGTICIEDLAVENLIKNHNVALSISDVGWASFSTMLGYKSEWKGRKLIKVGRFEPTSKTCSNCGKIQDMPLVERVYNCECGLSIDRDLNAAINIRNAGILHAGASVELLPLGKTVKQKIVGSK